MKSSHLEMAHSLDRRQALAALGGLGASVLIGGAVLPQAAAQTAFNCVLTPDLTEGPYFVASAIAGRRFSACQTVGVRPTR